MKKYSFNVYKAPILRDMKVGGIGFVLINPINNSIHGTTFLTEEFFIISSTLYLFDDIEQVKKYLSLTKGGLFPVEVKRTGEGLTDNDFLLNFRYLKDNPAGFKLLELSKDNLKLLKNDEFIFFENPNVINIKIDMDEFLLRKKDYHNTKDFIDDGMHLLDIGSSNLDVLNKTMERALENEDYETATKIRDEISRRKNNRKQKSD